LPEHLSCLSRIQGEQRETYRKKTQPEKNVNPVAKKIRTKNRWWAFNSFKAEKNRTKKEQSTNAQDSYRSA